jgi:hypothetical protein
MSNQLVSQMGVDQEFIDCDGPSGFGREMIHRPCLSRLYCRGKTELILAILPSIRQSWLRLILTVKLRKEP